MITVDEIVMVLVPDGVDRGARVLPRASIRMPGRHLERRERVAAEAVGEDHTGAIPDHVATVSQRPQAELECRLAASSVTDGMKDQTCACLPPPRAGIGARKIRHDGFSQGPQGLPCLITIRCVCGDDTDEAPDLCV